MKTLSTSAMIAFASLLCIQLHAGSTNRPSPEKPMKAPAKKEMVRRNCLEVNSSVSIFGKRMKDVTILLYKGDKLINTISASKKEVNSFVLQEDAQYTLRFTKPGCADRMICINTILPEGVDLKPLFEFDFDLDMIPEQEAAKNPAIDFPAGIIYFDEYTEKFERSDDYASSLKNLNKESLANH
jgi:hypothetical protein